MTPKAPILEMAGIEKAFAGPQVLRGVDFVLHRGEIRALVGQNGAGKSTLMKILSGVHQPDAGSIKVNGGIAELGEPGDARRLGIRMVYQEFSLVPQLSVWENLVLGNEPVVNGFLDRREAENAARNALERLGVTLDLETPVEALSVGKRQLVEIAKALVDSPSVLVLDEPTASLSQVEAATLFEVLRKLRSDGIGIVYISHHLDEVLALCDWVTVLRDGAVVGNLDPRSATMDDLLERMLGTSLAQMEAGVGPQPDVQGRPPLLDVRSLTDGQRLQDVSFVVGPGEVVGIAGVLGSGRTEILECLFGRRRYLTGDVQLKGRPFRPRGPSEAIARGAMLVPEDRRTLGILRGQTVHDNILLPVWSALSRALWIDDRRARVLVEGYMQDLSIQATGTDQPIERLSGGNQQKAIVARALVVKPGLLMLDEPTAGIDVGARQEIAEYVRDFASRGGGVLWVSSDMQELSQVCDRVVILRRGVTVGELEGGRTGRLTEPELHAAIQGGGSALNQRGATATPATY